MAQDCDARMHSGRRCLVVVILSNFIYKMLYAPTKIEGDVTPAFMFLSRIFLSAISIPTPSDTSVTDVTERKVNVEAAEFGTETTSWH